MSDLYTPGLTLQALTASPFVTPDGTITHGSDPAGTAPTPPVSSGGLGDYVAGILDNVPGFSTAAKTGAVIGMQATPAQKSDASQLVIDVILVVIGLMLLSRGFGLIGEEGAGVVVDLSNPAKYPGIGHAIQHARKGKN